MAKDQNTHFSKHICVNSQQIHEKIMAKHQLKLPHDLPVPVLGINPGQKCSYQHYK